MIAYQVAICYGLNTTYNDFYKNVRRPMNTWLLENTIGILWTIESHNHEYDAFIFKNFGDALAFKLTFSDVTENILEFEI